MPTVHPEVCRLSDPLTTDEARALMAALLVVGARQHIPGWLVNDVYTWATNRMMGRNILVKHILDKASEYRSDATPDEISEDQAVIEEIKHDPLSHLLNSGWLPGYLADLIRERLPRLVRTLDGSAPVATDGGGAILLAG